MSGLKAEDIPLLFLISTFERFGVVRAQGKVTNKCTFVRSKLCKFWVRTLWAPPWLKTFHYYFWFHLCTFWCRTCSGEGHRSTHSWDKNCGNFGYVLYERPQGWRRSTIIFDFTFALFGVVRAQGRVTEVHIHEIKIAEILGTYFMSGPKVEDIQFPLLPYFNFIIIAMFK